MKKDNKNKKKNNNEKAKVSISDAVMFINALTEQVENINEKVKNGVPLQVVEEEPPVKENNNICNDLGFLQNEEDVDDLELDEMNDIWDEIEDDEE